MKTIGILGGMGPDATVCQFQEIINLTKAERDQDHIQIIVINNPKIPDRTHAIYGKGDSPLPYLIESALKLEKLGADFILMPCITAHNYFDEIIEHVRIPFIHMIDETVKFVKDRYKQLKKFGILASNGTLYSQLFQKFFQKHQLKIVPPDEKNQELLMKVLYDKNGVKAGFRDHPQKKIQLILDHLYKKNSEAIIAGCTEIPLVITQADLSIPFINPLYICAIKSIQLAGYPLVDVNESTKK